MCTLKGLNVYTSVPDFFSRRWLLKNGGVVVDDIHEAELILFTGGSDVNPSLYGEEVGLYTRFNSRRDRFDCDVYAYGLAHNIPMVGYCRGSQFLNVMNKGKLIQHVEGHAGMDHHAATVDGKEVILVSSTHHQAVVPVTKENVLLYSCYKDGQPHHDSHVEGIIYPNTKCLGVQGHPEYSVSDKKYEEFSQFFIKHINNLTKGNS